MDFKYIAKNLGLLVTIYSFTMLPPVFIAHLYNEQSSLAFDISWLTLFLVGMLLWLPLRKNHYEPRIREGFLIVVVFWLTLCFLGALPFFIAENPDISYTDAIFEAVSGLTATGATVFSKLDTMPRSILFYRQQLQFLGGLGVLLLAVAILPTLGVGGMQLFRAEITGPNKDNRLTPKITQTAKSLWMIYIYLTVLCALSYWAAGMTLFDALSYSFGTVSTGGFTPHDASMAYYNSDIIKLIGAGFMLLGAINFYTHFFAIHTHRISPYRNNSEIKAIMMMYLAAIILIGFSFYCADLSVNGSKVVSIIFHVVSIGTTTGMSGTDYWNWPGVAPFLLLFLGVVGGCAGSTSGGIKLARILIMIKHSMREVYRLIHPQGHYIIKFNKSPVGTNILSAVWAFIGLYVALFVIFLLTLCALEVEFLTAFSATAATLSNIGPGLGEVAQNYQDLSSAAKWVLSLAMIAGRLEIFTILVLLSPTYWKN